MGENWTRYGGAAPFWPNFAQSMEMEFEFDTRINVSRDGTEQRVGWLPFPKTAVSFGSWARMGKLAALFDLRQTPNAPLIVPYFYKSVMLSAAADVGDTLLSLTGAVPAWLDDDVRLILHGPDADEGVVVDFTGPSNATLVTGLLRAWPAGSRAYLARQAFRHDSNTFQIVSRRMGLAAKPRFEFDSRSPAIPLTSASRTHETAGGRVLELFDFNANWRDGLTIKETPYLEEVVSRHGLRDLYAPHEFYGHNRQENHLLTNAEKVEGFTDFFMRHYGRQKAFWAKTYHPKLPMAEVIYPDEPGPTGLDASDLEYYPQLYPFNSNGGTDLFELTGSDGSVQLVDRMSRFGGERSIPVTFSTGLFPVDEFFPLITKEGPSRAHIEAGLVSLEWSVTASSPASWSSTARFYLQISGDFPNSNDLPENSQRWDGLVRERGGSRAYDPNISIDQEDTGPDIIYQDTGSFPIPVDSWFFRVRLNLFVFAVPPQIRESSFRLVWTALPEDYDIFETYQPITVPLPVTAEHYSIYRFDQDRLTVALRTGEVAESTVTLRALNESDE